MRAEQERNTNTCVRFSATKVKYERKKETMEHNSCSGGILNTNTAKINGHKSRGTYLGTWGHNLEHQKLQVGTLERNTSDDIKGQR